MYKLKYTQRRFKEFATKEELEAFIKSELECGMMADIQVTPEGIYPKANLDRRKYEYPSAEEVIEAMLDGDLEKILERRDEIKRKYPLEDKPSSYKVELAWGRFRNKRNDLLLRTDYTQLADAPLESSEKQEYRKYRQYLRDITNNYNNRTIWEAKLMTFEEWKQSLVK